MYSLLQAAVLTIPSILCSRRYANYTDYTNYTMCTLLQAAGGLVSVTGSAEEGQPPVRTTLVLSTAGTHSQPVRLQAAGCRPARLQVRVGCSIVDMCSGLHATIGILAALHQRGADGPGQRVYLVII